VSYFVGLDLGQTSDYTASAVIQAVHVRGEASSGQKVDRELHLRHLERYPLRTPYPEMVDRVATMIAAVEGASGESTAELLVDATGVGKPVTDLLRERGLRFRAVTITGGDKPSRAGVEHRVPKRDLIAALEVPFHTGELKIAAGLMLWPTLREELLNFRRKVNLKTAHDSYEAWREGDHDDLVLAAALAAWGAQRFPKTAPPDVRSLAAMSRSSYWSGAGGSSLVRRSWRV
jgi:hypothetical protein